MARLDADKTTLTAQEQRLWDALASGENVQIKDLKLVADPSGMCDLNNLRRAMSFLRTKIRATTNETIICEDGGYRRVAYTNSLE